MAAQRSASPVAARHRITRQASALGGRKTTESSSRRRCARRGKATRGAARHGEATQRKLLSRREQNYLEISRGYAWPDLAARGAAALRYASQEPVRAGKSSRKISPGRAAQRSAWRREAPHLNARQEFGPANKRSGRFQRVAARRVPQRGSTPHRIASQRKCLPERTENYSGISRGASCHRSTALAPAWQGRASQRKTSIG